MTHTLPAAEPTAAHPKRPFVAHALRILALPIILFWIAFAVAGECDRPATRGRRRAAFGSDGSRRMRRR